MQDYPTITLRGKSGWPYDFHILPIHYDYRTVELPGLFVISRNEYYQDEGKKLHTILYVGMTEDFSKALRNKEVIQLTMDAEATHFLLQHRDSRKVRQSIKKDLLDLYDPPMNKDATAYIQYRQRRKPQSDRRTPVKPHHPRTDCTNPPSPPVMQTRQCSRCYGSGTVVCSTCGGTGGRQDTRVDYDYDGNPQYNSEWINCYSCNNGYSSCSACNGSGQVYV